MRREPRCAVAVGPVAIAGIAGNAAFEERLEPGLRGGLAGLPSLAQAAGPIRPRRLKLPVSPACRLRGPPRRCSVFGAGNGFGGSPSACTRRQNGVNTRRPRFSLLRIWPGAHQQVAGKALRDDADLGRGRRRPDRPRPDAAPARSRSSTRLRHRSRAPVRR